MILPDKYTTLKDSFIFQSAIFLKLIGKNKITFDKLWDKYLKSDQKYIKEKISYAYYMSLIEFMYSTGMINYTAEGELYNENIESKNI